jgi:biotin carboxylase
MTKRILIIGAGWEQVSLIETAKNMGHYIIATHPHISADGFKLADQYYVKDSRDIKGHIAIAESHKIDAVLTDNCDYSLYTASIVASKLSLPFTSIQSALYSNDKFAQRECVSHSKVKQPIFVKIQTLDQLFDAIPKIGFPSILKPIDSRGTFGVTIIENETQLKQAFFDAINNSPSRTLIYEQFIKGTLVTVDGFCFKNGHQSLTVASRKFDDGPKPVTKEIIYPAIFEKIINESLMQAHHQVVNALGYRFGHTHGEYILTPDSEINLVECTNRGGGVYTSSVIVPLLTQYPINECLINQCLGIDEFMPPAVGLASMKCSVMLTFLDYEVGKVIDEINIEEMQKLPFTVRFRSKYGVNDMIESIENGAGRHSMLVIKAKNHNELLNNLNAFKQTLNIKYH